MTCPFCGQFFNGQGSLGMILSLFFTLCILVGAILLIVWFVRQGGSRQQLPETTDQVRRAIILLDERYARGEIDTAEYEERKRILLDRG